RCGGVVDGDNSRGLLGDLSRGLVALLLRLRSPLGKVSLLCNSRFW
ncbi:hypothetical protein Tco_0443706, partial [Tanacetum coccineum]